MTSRAFHATRIACAVAALGVSLSAQAQYRYGQANCVDSLMDAAAVYRDQDQYGPTGCIGTLSAR